MARVRIGPLSYGPGGRRGLHLGPVSASYNVHNPAFGAFMLVVVVLAVIIKFWPFLVVGGLAFLVFWLATKEKRAEQAAARARARAEAQQRWLQARHLRYTCLRASASSGSPRTFRAFTPGNCQR